MDSGKNCSHHAGGVECSTPAQEEKWRRHCGCLKTSDKLRLLLKTFPAPPPPPPPPTPLPCTQSSLRASYPYPSFRPADPSTSFKREFGVKLNEPDIFDKDQTSRSWRVVYELVQLVQMSVTATALAIYYLIYCYMQLIYYMLRSALYFHQADGPMKVTIGVVTLTSVIVGFNIILRIEKLIHIS